MKTTNNTIAVVLELGRMRGRMAFTSLPLLPR
jgi:hypothetical protein